MNIHICAQIQQSGEINFSIKAQERTRIQQPEMYAYATHLLIR